MAKPKIHIVLDRSSSMGAIRDKTISGVNEYVQTIATDTPDAKITVSTFSSIVDEKLLVDNVKASDFVPLNADTYQPFGSTALLDAIETGVRSLDALKGKIKILVIVTDGEENASREATNASVRKLLEDRQENKNWLVQYLGANQDAFTNGARFGSNHHNTLNFKTSNINTAMSVSSLAGTRYLKSGGNRVMASYTSAERTAAVANVDNT